MAIRGRVANPLGLRMREFESHLLRHFKFDFIIKIIYNKYTISKEKRYASLAQSGLRATGFYPVCRRFESFKGAHLKFDFFKNFVYNKYTI